MDARACVLLFVLGVSCVAAQTTAAGTEVAWWGKVKPWKPSHNKPSIFQPLVLKSISTQVSGGLTNLTAGSPMVDWSNVVCPANRDSTTPIGDAAWTETLLGDLPGATTGASGTTPANQSNVVIVFKLDSSCCGYGTGTISVIGRKSGDGSSPESYTILGGTGDFCFINGGILTVTTGLDGSISYKFHFYYYKY